MSTHSACQELCTQQHAGMEVCPGTHSIYYKERACNNDFNAMPGRDRVDAEKTLQDEELKGNRAKAQF